MLEPSSQGRPPSRAILLAIRRVHLYLGLALFPWAILYGVTAFLFNHPTVLSDQVLQSYGYSELVGTPAEAMPTANELAEFVVRKLNEIQQPVTPYAIVGDAKFNREFAFATVRQSSQTLGLLLDVKSLRGTIRIAPSVETPKAVAAPFAIGTTAQPNEPRSAKPSTTRGIVIDDPPQARFRAAIPTILERSGFPDEGEITVTSVPEVVLTITADGAPWAATYNPMTGSVSGSVPRPAEPLTWRRFALRLHTAHGYPGEANARWFWAVIVDVMAFVLCFWGVSGLLMWWQVKATRRLGLVILLLSGLAATILGVAMHHAM